MAKTWSGVGDFKIDGENIFIDGINSFIGGEFNEIKIDGVTTVTGPIKANKILINGIFKTEDYIEANLLDVDGVATIKKNVRAHEVDVAGTVSIKSEKFEADSIKCDGIISVSGEINADKMFVKGIISAKEIYGDNIDISSNIKGTEIVKAIKNFFGIQRGHFSKIETIEATTINIVNVKAKQLRGHDIIIGKDCTVENVDCDGILRISKSANVKNITGSHVFKETFE